MAYQQCDKALELDWMAGSTGKQEHVTWAGKTYTGLRRAASKAANELYARVPDILVALKPSCSG